MANSRRLILLLAAILVWSAPAFAAERVKIRALVPLKNMDESVAQFIVAKYLGYYEQEGLDVDLIAVGGSNEVAIQIGAGNGDIGEATPAQAVISMQDGMTASLDIRYYYDVGYKNIWFVSVPAESPIRSIADLKGKKIGVPSLGSAGLTYGKAYMRAGGLDADKDISWIPIGTGAQALVAVRQGLVDAIVFWNAGLARLDVSGLKLRQLPIDEKLARLPDVSLLVKQDMITTRPKILIGFARALSKALDFTLANPAAAVLISWAQYPEAKPKDTDPAAQLRQGLAILKSKTDDWVSPDTVGRHGLFIQKDWETLGRFLLGEKQLAKPVPTTRMYTNELIEQINDYDKNAVIAQAKNFDLASIK